MFSTTTLDKKFEIGTELLKIRLTRSFIIGALYYLRKKATGAKELGTLFKSNKLYLLDIRQRIARKLRVFETLQA